MPLIVEQGLPSSWHGGLQAPDRPPLSEAVERLGAAVLELSRRAEGTGQSEARQLIARMIMEQILRRADAQRVRTAKDLLGDPGLSVKEVAAAVGYANTSQLDRQFKRHCHATPSVFRTTCIPGVGLEAKR